MQRDTTSAPRIDAGVSLRALNTFGVEARAAWFTTVRDRAELKAVHADPRCRTGARLVLGGGSNILFTRDFAGLVIHNAIAGIDVVREDEAHAWVRVGAGEVWHDFVLWAVERGVGGIENLALIPGRVGAAPMQNIGAYGVEMESTCESVETWDWQSGSERTFTHAECAFGYRDSIFKHAERDRHCITAVTFRLSKQPQLVTTYGDVRQTLDAMGVTTPGIRDVADAVIRIRTAKLPNPQRIGNAGSFFKNPVLPAAHWRALVAAHPAMPHFVQPGSDDAKVPAAWLIEQCGWKGRIVGDAAVHDRQALVLVNRGNASGSDILALGRAIQSDVRTRFGVELSPEVSIL